MSSAPATALAALAGAAGAASAVTLGSEVAARLGSRLALPASRARRAAKEAFAPLRRAGSEGVDPTRAQRRRLRLAFGFAALPVGWVAADIFAAAGLAGLAAFMSSRAVVWRRERYVARIARGAGPAALSIADAISSGHSTRGSLAIAASALEGPIGVELRKLAADLHLGAPTDAALERFRLRASCLSVDLVVAAIELQRHSGGNLAALLRDIAATIEEQSRLEDEVRATTSQARFTSRIVLGMPVGLLALGELADPGVLGRLTGSPAGIWLLCGALLLWVTGALLVRRLARVVI
jgi:tight adherence protein B